MFSPTSDVISRVGGDYNAGRSSMLSIPLQQLFVFNIEWKNGCDQDALHSALP